MILKKKNTLRVRKDLTKMSWTYMSEVHDGHPSPHCPVTSPLHAGHTTPNSRLQINDSRLPTLDFRLPTANSRLPTPDSRLSTPNSRLDSRLPTRGSQVTYSRIVVGLALIQAYPPSSMIITGPAQAKEYFSFSRCFTGTASSISSVSFEPNLHELHSTVAFTVTGVHLCSGVDNLESLFQQS